MRRYAKAAFLIGVVIILYFGAGAVLLRFAVERHTIVSAELPSSKGEALTARTVGSGTSGCVVVFPGRHGPSPAYEAAVVPPLTRRDVKVILMSYPARASLNEIRELARLAVNEVTKECANVVLVGRSLGSMVAAYASRDARVVGLLLESTSPRFSTAIRREFGRRWYLRPMDLLPVGYLVPEDYSLTDAFHDSRVPRTVILQGADDEQTPLTDLTDSGALPPGVVLLPVAHANHSNVFSRALPKYIETILDMLRRPDEREDTPTH